MTNKAGVLLKTRDRVQKKKNGTIPFVARQFMSNSSYKPCGNSRVGQIIRLVNPLLPPQERPAAPGVFGALVKVKKCDGCHNGL